MTTIKELELRIEKLEAIVFGQNTTTFETKSKEVTLQELKNRTTFSNGQERVVFIIGYLELVLNIEKITQKEIRIKWREGKFKGKFNSNFLQRAYSEGLIRKDKDNYDLSSSGETFFKMMLDNAQ